MKRFLFLLMLVCSFRMCPAQEMPDFHEMSVEKKVSDYSLDSINLSSPLDYFLSRAQVRLSGEYKKWGDISTSMFDYSADVPDDVVDEALRNYILGENIDFIITYRDSVATVVTHNEGEDIVLLNNCWLEDGRWVNRGQGLASGFDQARDKIYKELPQALYNLPRVAVINDMPEDVSPFLDFLAGVQSSPEEFMLDMLGSHKVVINGEYHRRKVSWDMLKRLIALPEFPERVGCIFMELPSWHQSTMDGIMAADTLDVEAIYQIFRDEQLNGWWDRGECEFLCELWALNQTLPVGKKIKVVLADYQISYSLVTTPEAGVATENRNTHMADIVINTVKNSEDNRNNLFLVGCAHVYKSNQPGIASAARGKEEKLTAGAQIAATLGDENVFTVFQHVLPGDNHGGNKAPIRGGIFDRAFELNGNRPVGFKLSGSPFGTEPFDGIYEIKFSSATGSYEDNFDGYLFLCPLNQEPKAEPLVEIFTDEFVEEMKRRASVLGYERLSWIWFGQHASKMTKEAIIEDLLQE